MNLWILAAVAFAGADTETDVDYLWRTGQQAKAVELIADAYEAEPENLTNQRLNIASRVHAGDGGALELQHRQYYNDNNDDLRVRLGLANVLAYRNAKKGPWCKDAEVLLQTIGDSDEALHQEAVQARILVHARCEIPTDSDEADWVKIIKSGQLGTAEKTAYEAGGGYAEVNLADSIKVTLAKSPRHVEYMVPLWNEDNGGPGLLTAQKVSLKGAKAAMAGDDAQAAAAAYWFYDGIENDKLATKALAAWKALDPVAKHEENGALSDISDPNIYKRMAKAGTDVAALDELAEKIPESGYLTAYYQHLRYLALAEADKDEEAFDAAKAAYQAAPDVITIAQKFGQASAGLQKNLKLGLKAIETSMANPESNRHGVRVFIRSQIYVGLERYQDAETDLLSLFETKPTSRLYHRSLGKLYKTMDETESAIVHYTAAMQDPDAKEPPARSEKRRNNLMSDDRGWVDGPKKLKGRAFPIELEESRATVSAVVIGASWSAPTKAALEDLADLVDSHGKNGFKAIALLIDRNEPDMDALVKANPNVTVVYAGPEAARQGRIQTIPTTYVLDDRHRVLGAFNEGGWTKAAELILSKAK